MTPSSPARGPRREYRMPWRKRFQFLAAGAALIGLSLALLKWDVPAALGLSHSAWGAVYVMVMIGGLAGGIEILVRSLPSRLVIDGTRIDIRTIFRDFSADLGEIEGTYSVEPGFGKQTVLRLKGSGRTMRIPKAIRIDDDLRAWLGQLPDVHVVNRQRRLAAVAAAQSLGDSEQQRLRALKRARWVVLALTLATLIAPFGLYLCSRAAPTRIQRLFALILVLAPVLATLLVKRSPLLFTVGAEERDPRADLSAPLVLASIGPFMFMVPRMDAFAAIEPLVAIKPLLFVSLPLAAICTAVLAKCCFDRRLALVEPLGVFLLVSMFAFGLVASADIYGDFAAPAHHEVVISDDQIHAAPAPNTHALTLAPWGPIRKPLLVGLDAEAYRRVSGSHRLCVDLHPGLLRIPWYEVVPCQYRSASE